MNNYVRPHRNKMSSEKKAFAKYLRKNKTPAEAALWGVLRTRKLDGYRWHCSHPMLGWIVDFWCPALKLVIEVDGGYHNTYDQQRVDSVKSKSIEDFGFRIIRFTNDEILSDMESVKKVIRETYDQGTIDFP